MSWQKMESAWRKEAAMDYLVVLFTMLMIAGYACIIGRTLSGAE